MTRIAVVKREKCNPSGCGDKLCKRVCPVNRSGKECIVDSNGKIAINEKLCVGCNICSNRCPFGAISIVNLPEALKDAPIHRYSKNGFELFSLPQPMFGKVVGILGKNGIGKTTAIKIIAGLLKPNLGKDKADFNDVLEFFKGTEAQGFFEKIRDGKIKTSYKPQQVDLIPKEFDGKVVELLKKADGKGKLDEIAKELGIGKILESNIKEISGGELQRVAIAATVLKKANLYIFDEPSSYLDIKQRIKVSKFIRGLADEETAVLVVEHDLIILDYMTDLVHVMYGKEDCYGVVSQLKNTRAGINVYLSGFLKEENIRFREYEIKFLSKPLVKKKRENVLTSWNEVEKKLGGFSLTAKKGSIYKHEVVGVLGENAIGKTSFVKILAGVLKQDKGKIDEKIKVSYKPQYLGTSEENVSAVLKDAIKYETQLIRPLQIKPLMAKKIGELSGGELQRVAIALCLSKDADLFLLDEPSAYLDAEQRLVVSKIIKDFMEEKGTSALVVDHDLLFIDYISENLIVFDGIPAEKGGVNGPFSMVEGMNMFLKDLDITMRRDAESLRPRINKPGSQLDQKQKQEGKLYYA